MLKGKNNIVFFLLSIVIVSMIVFGAMSFSVNNVKKAYDFNDSTPVWELLGILGRENAPILKSMAGASVEKGRDLVHKGYTFTDKNKKTKKISKFFVCTSCHNVKKEFEFQNQISAENRLSYADKNGLPFLQGSTFYGIVNRSSFFNDDYQNKFKEERGIKEANKDLRAAVNFCARVGTQGRDLEEWEIESILAYFWTLQFKIGDLNLSDQDKQIIKDCIPNNSRKNEALKIIESKFVAAMPANFLKIPRFQELEEGELNDATRIHQGKVIYNQSCLHCHLHKKYSFFGLENDRITLKSMESATRNQNYIFSMYYLVREGLDPRAGHRSYMPLFSAEKMSEEQLKNLYIYAYNVSKGKTETK